MNWLSYLIPQELIRVQSPFNGEIKVVERFGKRILYANGDEQSGGTITGMWEKAIRKIRNPKSEIRDCLLLGLGGGTVIHLLNKYYPEADITAIEIDPVMIDIYKKYFEHNSPNSPSYLKRGLGGVNIIQADAFFWVKKRDKKRFDLIIYDVYIGKFNPPKAKTRIFLKKMKSLLRTRGMILFNRYYQNDEALYQKFLKTCKKTFNRVELILTYPYSRILKLR